MEPIAAHGEPVERPAAVGRWPSFREGFLAPWDGLTHMCSNPSLWRYGVIPVILNVLITGVVLLLLIVVAGYAVDRLHHMFPDGWGWLALEIVCGAGLLLVALVGAFISWLLMQSILCGYFYGQLAKQVELQLGMTPDAMRDISFAAQIADTLRDVTTLVIINVGLLLLHVVPLIGSVVATGGSLYFNFLILGSGFINYPLDLRGLRRAEKRAFVKRHRFHTLGLGAAVMLLLLVPVVGAVFLTTAVTGSVLLHRRLTGNDPAVSTTV